MCASDLQRQVFWLLFGVSDSSLSYWADAHIFVTESFELRATFFLLGIPGL